jgi:RNase P/RNase MRP subunit POP5
MVVKSKRGRRRYIAIRVRGDGRMTDEGLLSALNSSLYRSGVRYKVIQFDGREGIVRVGGIDRDRAQKALEELAGDALVTLRISGTLRTLREGVLVEKAKEARE